MRRTERILEGRQQYVIKRDNWRVVLEEEDSPKDILHHLGHGFRRVLGLTGCNGDGFGTTIWENIVS